MLNEMGKAQKYRMPRIALTVIAVALFVLQWLLGDFPVWLFAAPINILLCALWLIALWEGYRRRATSTVVQYLLSAEATYTALGVAATIALVLGLQSEPAMTSWPVVGGILFVQSVLTLVILRGWRNENGVRWRFLITHCGLWLAVASAFFGAPDKQILRVQVGSAPTREALSEQGRRSYLDYELRLDDFEVEHSKSGTPERFCASVAVDDKVVDIEVNSPYSPRFGEDIYLMNYAPDGCLLQVVREPWRGITAAGIALLLLGAFMLFMQGFQKRAR